LKIDSLRLRLRGVTLSSESKNTDNSIRMKWKQTNDDYRYSCRPPRCYTCI